MNKVLELIEEIISPEAMDLCTQFRDDVQEMSEQLERQGQRLIDLKEKKQSDPGEFGILAELTAQLMRLSRHLLRSGRAKPA